METREENDDANKRIAATLRSEPSKLQYIKLFYDHRERFSHYVGTTRIGSVSFAKDGTRIYSPRIIEENAASVIANIWTSRASVSTV
jgi:hypothetical protein